MATNTLFTPALSSHKEKNLAIAAKLLAITLYCGNNIISKSLTTHPEHALSVEAMLFYQYGFACLLLLPYAHITQKAWQYPLSITHHAGRIICCCSGLIFLHDAFKHMPVAQAVGFNIFSPFITLLGSCLLLRETITWEKLIALGLSILAYLCLLQPTSSTQPLLDLSTWHVLKPSLAILCFQANTFFTKWLANQGESHFMLTASVLLCIPLCLLPDILISAQTPHSTTQVALLAWMGCNDFLAMLALNYAITKADVSFLLPLGFSKYALIAGLGYWAFHETLSLQQTLGLILGCVCVWLLQKRA